MKTRHIVLLVLLLIVVLVGFGVQIFLTRGLATVLNQTVFPKIHAEYGLDLSVEDASVNLLKRRAEFWGFAIRNLEGFEEPTLITFDKLKIDLELLSLLTRTPVVLKQIKATGGTLVIERNDDRDFNIEKLDNATKSKPVPAPSSEPVQPVNAPPLDVSTEPAPEEHLATPAPTKTTPGRIPLHIRRLVLDGTVLYTDPKLELHIPLALRLIANDLFSIPVEGHPDSLIILRGAHADNPDTFVTDLSARLKPLLDPDNPSFNISGSVNTIDAALLKDLLEKNDMESPLFSIRPSITCQEGRIDGSEVSVTLRDLKYRNAKLGNATLKFPFTGTLQNPECDLTAALQSLFSAQTMDLLQQLHKALAPPPEKAQTPTGTNNAPSAPPPPKPDADASLGNLLFEQLEKSVKEVGGDNDVQDTLRSLFDR